MKDSVTTSCQVLRFEDRREQENRFVLECQRGDANAWTELVRRHTRYVHSLCYRFTRRDCEASELTQEVFLRVFCTLGSFRPEEQSFVAWLTRVTRNLLIDNYRRARRERKTVSIEDLQPQLRVLASASERPDGAYKRRESSRILFSALTKVPPYLRETIALYEIDELRYRDIARIQGVPIGTVKSRLKRGRATLAHLLRRHGTAA
jgi:RNA polymerase sigma-70 factor, ECF subfamily